MMVRKLGAGDCPHCGHGIEMVQEKPGAKPRVVAAGNVVRSVVVDQPGHPVAAPCTLEHCKHFDLDDQLASLAKAATSLEDDRETNAALANEFRAALLAIYQAARGDEKSEYWTLRKFLDDHGVYNENLSSLDRLVEEACKVALGIK